MSRSAEPKLRCERLKRFVSVLPGAGSEPVTMEGKQVEPSGVVCRACTVKNSERDALLEARAGSPGPRVATHPVRQPRAELERGCKFEVFGSQRGIPA